MSHRNRIAFLRAFLVRVSCAAIAGTMLLAAPARGQQAYHFAFGITPANGPSWGTGTHSNTVSVTNNGSSTIPAGVVLSLENRMGTGLNNLTFVTGSGTFNGTKVTQSGPCTPYAMSPYIGSTGHYASLNCKGTLNSAFAPGQTITATYTFTITTPTPQLLMTSNNLLDCGTGWVVTPGYAFTGGGAVYCGAPATATTGTLVVRKVVINTLGVANPATFSMVTHCSANAATPGLNTPVSVPPGGSVTQAPPVAAGNQCSVTESVPPPVLNVPACNGGSASWNATYSPVVTITANGTSVLTVTNTLTCDKPVPTGTLAVRKIVVNSTGGAAPIPATFNTVTHCSAAGAPAVNTPLAVPGNGSVTQSPAPATGAACAVTETLPPPIPGLEGCKGRNAVWTESHTGPVTIVAGQAAVLSITNTLACQAPRGGTLQIHKSVVNTLGVPTPANFNMVASCSGMAPVPVVVAVNGTVTVPPAGNIADATVCTITETLPPQLTGVKACPSGTATWVASNPGPLTVHLAQTTGTIITNTLTCDKAPAGGHLTVNKVVVNLTNGPAPIPPTFSVMAHCTLSGASTLNATLPVPTGSGVSAAAAIAAGSNCSIMEGPLPPIPGLKACKGASASWTSSYSPAAVIVAGATTTLTATNTLRCDAAPATGTLRIIKSVVNATTGPAPIPATFAMTVTCTPSGPSNQSIAVAPGAAGHSIGGIAAPSHCTVVEAPLAPIAHAEGCHGGSASWTSVVSPGQPVAITTNGTTTVTYRNTLTCDKPNNTNCPDKTLTTIGCRVTVTIKRSKGPLIYSVTASPVASYPTPNILPSTATSCVIAAGAMINQTTCWFNYNTNPTPVTLTATSSAGALPAGFSWSGACSGSSATCVVSATLSMPPSVIANFP